MALKFSKKTKPKEIFFDGKINILWADGLHSRYDYHLLRCLCVCASCVDEITGVKILDDERVAQDIHPVSSEYVGNYALGITWSDGHSTGLYTFQRLRHEIPFEEGSKVN